MRELQLAFLRNGLREIPDPDTGLDFTEDTLRLATQPGSRFFVEADAIDLALMGGAMRAEFFAQQVRIDRAGTSWLRGYHFPLWGEQYLPGSGGVGTVLATGTPGTTWLGSTTVPDAAATYGRDPAGNRFQVLVDATADADGEALVTLGGIDTGDETNLAVGTVIRWANPPGGSDPEATVDSNDFAGGNPPESDADASDRLSSRVRHKPAAGNAAQFRAWAREASVSVEDAFVYPTALQAGSVVVVPTKKRGSTAGPSARMPDFGVLSVVSEYLVPPASPVVPPQADVRVMAPTTEASDLVLALNLLKGSTVGWADPEPFPQTQGASPVRVTTVTTQLNWRITCGAAGELPGGATGPLAGVSLMIWDVPTSRFIELDVATVEDLGAGVYRVILNTPPAGHTVALDDYVSPLTERREAIAEAVEAYFDSLGPGELIDLDNDPRGATAFRRPATSEEYPSRAGQSVITFIADALGSALADSTLDTISVTAPDVPADPLDGPEMLILGKLGLLPLD
jgi:hypothetical protein